MRAAVYARFSSENQAPMACGLAPKCVGISAQVLRNGCPSASGIGAQVPSESVPESARNTHLANDLRRRLRPDIRVGGLRHPLRRRGLSGAVGDGLCDVRTVLHGERRVRVQSVQNGVPPFRLAWRSGSRLPRSVLARWVRRLLLAGQRVRPIGAWTSVARMHGLGLFMVSPDRGLRRQPDRCRSRPSGGRRVRWRCR